MLSAENFTFALCKNIPLLAETGGGGGVWSWGLALRVSDSFIYTV